MYPRIQVTCCHAISVYCVILKIGSNPTIMKYSLEHEERKVILVDIKVNRIKFHSTVEEMQRPAAAAWIHTSVVLVLTKFTLSAVFFERTRKKRFFPRLKFTSRCPKKLSTSYFTHLLRTQKKKAETT